jgi:hypothetical protein
MMTPRRKESFGTPGIWFTLSFAGMPNVYNLPLMPALALIVLVFPVVCYVLYRMTQTRGRTLFCIAYATAGVAFLIGLATFLEARGQFERPSMAIVFLGHLLLGVWAIVRALRLAFQRDIRFIC